MTTAPLSVIVGVFRDHRLAEQALEELKQSGWIIGTPQILERNTRGIFGAFKSPAGSSTEEQMPAELSQLNLPEEERQLYQHEFMQGSSLVLAHPQNHLLEIRDVLNRYGAYHVFIPFEVGGEQTISLRQEVPQVQKRIVQVGEIRLHKRVITEQRTFTIPVTREEVTIERIPLSLTAQPPTDPGPPDSGSIQTQATPSSLEGVVLPEEGTIRILVHEEQVVIQKQTAVIEEIIIQKHLVEDVKHLVEPFKHEEARVEHIGNARVHENNTQESSL